MALRYADMLQARRIEHRLGINLDDTTVGDHDPDTEIVEFAAGLLPWLAAG